MTIFDSIVRPTLLLDEARCRANIARMAARAKASGARFRPHFKTHQSAVVGEWFRAEGVSAITVSSVGMARYFARAGWNDITVAFPVNLRQIAEIDVLAAWTTLGLLVDSVESAEFLAGHLRAQVHAWVEVDVGQHRSGIPVEQVEVIRTLARAIRSAPRLRLRGVLAHAGQLYHAGSPERVRAEYASISARLADLRESFRREGFEDFEISWGDTPTCSLVDNLSSMNELRPGNFVFYDLEQLHLGACREEDVAVALACPVASLRGDERAVFYGGAVHLSKEMLELDGSPCYGELALPGEHGWGARLPGARVVSLSQEHGVAHLEPQDLARLRPGDLVVVLPVHSCLTVDLMGGYTTLGGERITTLGRV